MKDRSQKICGHVVYVNQRNEDCSFHILCGFFCVFFVLFFWGGYPCMEGENMTLQCRKVMEFGKLLGQTYPYMYPASLECTFLKLF